MKYIASLRNYLSVGRRQTPCPHFAAAVAPHKSVSCALGLSSITSTDDIHNFQGKEDQIINKRNGYVAANVTSTIEAQPCRSCANTKSSLAWLRIPPPSYHPDQAVPSVLGTVAIKPLIPALVGVVVLSSPDADVGPELGPVPLAFFSSSPLSS